MQKLVNKNLRNNKNNLKLNPSSIPTSAKNSSTDTLHQHCDLTNVGCYAVINTISLNN